MGEAAYPLKGRANGRRTGQAASQFRAMTRQLAGEFVPLCRFAPTTGSLCGKWGLLLLLNADYGAFAVTKVYHIEASVLYIADQHSGQQTLPARWNRTVKLDNQ